MAKKRFLMIMLIWSTMVWFLLSSVASRFVQFGLVLLIADAVVMGTLLGLVTVVSFQCLNAFKKESE